MNSELKDLFKSVTGEKEQKWVSKLADMIRIDSQSGGEKELADFITDELNELGIENEQFDVPRDIVPAKEHPEWFFRGRPNVVGKIPGARSGGKSLILHCHTDTQPVYPRELWTYDPFGAQIVDGRMYGRGSVDDKAGIASILYIADVITSLELIPGGDMLLQFVVEDETSGLGALACVKRGYRADGFIMVDGSNLDNAFLAHPGHLNFQIEIFGVPTTNASAFRARNPFYTAYNIAVRLKELENVLREECGGDPGSIKNSVNLTLLLAECGHTTGAVPSRAMMSGNLSFGPPVSVDQLKKRIREAVSSAFSDEGGQSCEEPAVSFSGYECEPVMDMNMSQSDLAGLLLKNAVEYENIKVNLLPMRGYADIRYFIEMTGGNSFLYGPGEGGGVHINDEYFVISDMRKCVNILCGVVSDWCGLSPR